MNVRRFIGILLAGCVLFALAGCTRDPQKHAQDASVKKLREAASAASYETLDPFLELGTVEGVRMGDWCDGGENGPIWKSVYKFQCSYETHALVTPAQSSLEDLITAAQQIFDQLGCAPTVRAEEYRDNSLEHWGHSGIIGGPCGDINVHLSVYVTDYQVQSLNTFTPFTYTGFWVERTFFPDEALAKVGTTEPFMLVIKTSTWYAYEER